MISLAILITTYRRTIRASSSTLHQKNSKIGNISLENRNKIGIYEIKEEQNRNIGSLKQLILLIFNNYRIKYYNHCFDIGNGKSSLI